MSNNRRNQPRPAAAVEAADSTVLDLTSAERTEPEREPAFTIGGRTYTMLKEVPISAAMAYIDVGGRMNTDAGILFMLRYALGEDGYLALRDYNELTDGQFAAVVELIRPKFDRSLDPKAR